MLPDQMPEVSRKPPVARLMIAILEEAAMTLARTSHATTNIGKHAYAETYRWLHRKGRGWIFDFENICEVFGWHPVRMRTILLEAVRDGRISRGAMFRRHCGQRHKMGGNSWTRV